MYVCIKILIFLHLFTTVTKMHIMHICVFNNIHTIYCQPKWNLNKAQSRQIGDQGLMFILESFPISLQKLKFFDTYNRYV